MSEVDPTIETGTQEATETPELKPGESLIELEATPEASADPEQGAETATEIELDGEKVSVPEAVAKHIEELQKNADAAGQSQAPEGDYALTVPEDMAKAGIEADPTDPMFVLAQEIGKAEGWSQETFDALSAGYYQLKLAESQQDATAHADEKTKLIAAYNDGGNKTDDDALKAASEVGRWASTIIGPDMVKNPGLVEELKVLTATADGIALLEAIRNRTGDTTLPGNQDTDTAPTTDPLKAMYPSMHDS